MASIRDLLAREILFLITLNLWMQKKPHDLSEAICWILANNYSNPHLIHLLSNFLIISPPNAIPATNILTVQKAVAELGISIAQEKTWPNPISIQFIEFLGISLDSVKFALPKEKIDRIILVTLVESLKCSKSGHLIFTMRIILQDHPFISHLLTLASLAQALEDQIPITQACCNKLMDHPP